MIPALPPLLRTVSSNGAGKTRTSLQEIFLPCKTFRQHTTQLGGDAAYVHARSIPNYGVIPAQIVTTENAFAVRPLRAALGLVPLMALRQCFFRCLLTSTASVIPNTTATATAIHVHAHRHHPLAQDPLEALVVSHIGPDQNKSRHRNKVRSTSQSFGRS